MISNRYISFIDVSKAVAALCVSLYHFIDHSDHTGRLIESNSWMLHGFTSVLWSTVFVFFVISGFAISAHLANASYQISDLPKFLGKRIIRIYFPYLACIFGYMLMEMFFNWHNHRPQEIDWRQFLSNLTFTADFLGEKWYNPVFWTLAIEIQFYILIALLWPVFRFLTDRKLFWVIMTFLLVIPFLVTDNRLIFIYLPMVGVGYVLFEERNQSISRLFCMASVILCCICTAYIFQSILIGVMLALFAGLFLFANIRDTFPGFSRMTYSYYLFHGLSGGTFLYFTARHADSVWFALLLIVTAVIVSICFTYLAFLLLEKPSVNWSKKWIRYKK